MNWSLTRDTRFKLEQVQPCLVKLAFIVTSLKMID